MEYLEFAMASINVLIDRSGNIYNKFIEYFINDNKNKIVKKRIYDIVPYLTQTNIFFSQPTYIIDNIYLGSAFNASCNSTMKNNNIELIINLTTDISNYFEKDFIYKNYPLHDNNKDSIKQYLDKAYQEILDFQEKNNGKNIFIHCFMGASRSASIVIYYLIKKYEYTIDDAIIFIKNKREVVNPTVLFYKEINEM